MIRYMKDGFQLTRGQSFAIGVMFLFQFIWSVLFYRFIQHHVVAVMQRFPPQQLTADHVNLFVNESAMRLFETNLAIPFLWSLLTFFVVRCIITPILTAGIYDSLHSSGPRGTIFIQGIKRLGGSFTLLFWIRNLLIAIPLYWLIPNTIQHLLQAESYVSLVTHLMPIVLGMMIYSSLLKLIFIYMQLAKTTNTGLLQAILVSFRHLLPICVLALVVFSISILCGLLIFVAGMYWAGFLVLLLHLLYPLLQMVLKVWGVSVQYRFWQNNRP